MIAPGTTGFLLLCLLGYVVFASVFGYGAMAIDKRRAEQREWRVPEATLLLLALAGGWPGVKLAQQRLRHKTVSQPFRALLTLIGLVQAGLLLAALMPATWVERGAQVAVEVAAPAGIAALQTVGNAVSGVVREVLTVPTPLDEPEGDETGLPKRFGPGADTGG